MKCPFCAHLDDKVIDSREGRTGDTIRRRRECLKCSRRFTTYERIDEIPYMVIKKDGRRERFERQKILQGLLKACEKRPVPTPKLESIVDEIEGVVHDATERELTTTEIGEMIMHRLKKLDKVAYVRFASVYMDFKDVQEFMSELKNLLKDRGVKKELFTMPVIISMLRGVNVGGHNKIKMDVLRDLCISLKFQDPQTLLQSGNVVFRAGSQNPAQILKLLETALERKLGFRPKVISRTVPELRDVIARSPFAKRRGLDPGKLVVTFLGGEPTAEARKALLDMDIAPEELHVLGRELHIYFPNGQGRPRLSWQQVDKILGAQCAPGTARNWNTVTKLLQLAESLEASS